MVNGQRVVIDAVPCCRLTHGGVIRWADQDPAAIERPRPSQWLVEASP